MDLAQDLSRPWMSRPGGVRVGVQMDSEKPARITHTLSLWDFSLLLSLSLSQKFNIRAVPTLPLSSKNGTNQRGSGVALAVQDASSLIPAVLHKPTAPPPLLSFILPFFSPFGPRNIGFSKKMVLQLSLLIILSLILKMHRQNVANKIVIYPHHASKRLQVSPSCSTSSLRAGVWSY